MNRSWRIVHAATKQSCGRFQSPRVLSSLARPASQERLQELLAAPVAELRALADASGLVPEGSACDIASQLLAVEAARARFDSSAGDGAPTYTGPVLPEVQVGGASVPCVSMEWVQSVLAYMKSLQGPLPKEHVLFVLRQAELLHRHAPNVAEVAIPRFKAAAYSEQCRVTVVGDTHGQFFDLLHLFSDAVAGFPSPRAPFVFNGDFVDRGVYSFEVVFALLAIKVASPQSVHLIRGNHETTDMNETYGFAAQVLQKYDKEVLAQFRRVFRTLPLATTINKKVFVTHGGLGKATAAMSVSELQQLDRQVEPSFPSAVSELLWSDPTDSSDGLSANRQRGAGWRFGKAVTNSFLHRNGLELLVRSHEVRQQGYSVEHDGRLVTVFSAPNYCDAQGNLGAVLVFERKSEKVEVDSAEAPPVPRNSAFDREGTRVYSVDDAEEAAASDLILNDTKPEEEMSASVLQFEAVPHPLYRAPAKSKRK